MQTDQRRRRRRVIRNQSSSGFSYLLIDVCDVKMALEPSDYLPRETIVSFERTMGASLIVQI